MGLFAPFGTLLLSKIPYDDSDGLWEVQLLWIYIDPDPSFYRNTVVKRHFENQISILVFQLIFVEVVCWFSNFADVKNTRWWQHCSLRSALVVIVFRSSSLGEVIRDHLWAVLRVGETKTTTALENLVEKVFEKWLWKR